MIFYLILLQLLALSSALVQNGRNVKFINSKTRKFLFGSPEPPKNPIKKEGGGGLFGGMGNMMEQVKKAQEIAKMAEALNKELMDTTVTGNDPSGQITASVNGLGVPLGVKIPDSMLSLGAEALSVATSQAIIDAHSKSQSNMVQRMQALYGNVGGVPPNK